jgi:GTP:adenosylcobinamide-phosphate guanylyltransferase
MKAIICGAGFGSRLGLKLPKILVEVHGRTILDYQLEALKDVEEIRIVAGYKSDLVVETCKKYQNVKIFFNHDYATTGVPHSIRIASEDLDEETLIVDGDLIFDPIKFDNKCICIKIPNSEEPVYANVSEENVIGFNRIKGTYEWACMCVVNPKIFNPSDKYVFESLERHLPIKHKLIEALEIDTISDLRNAERCLKKKI